MKLKLISAAIFSLAVLAACGDKGKKPGTTQTTTQSTKNNGTQGLKLAFVNADTLNKYYLYLKDQEAAFKKKQDAYEGEMANKEKALQNEFAAFQKKVQAGTMTQAEGEATQKRLGQQQQALEKRHQTISAEIAKEQMAIQEEFQKKLDEFLARFNEERQYDFIFTYLKSGGPILYANKAYDITQEVLDAMNEDYKNGGNKKEIPAAATDTTKK
ncbi:MAG: OmpH family outer membrane protein [Sphingobacteriales bacterium]|nr:MAG: OmpH family outer membrane protein [Sphingobacteriales bacterium]